MSYNNNQSNDTRNSQLDPAGEPVTLIQNNCYSSAAPTVQSLDTTVATITFNSNLEDIPVPRLQMTNLICLSHPNALNKPQDFNNPITGVIEQQVIMEHVISPNAQSIDFRAIGDSGAVGGVVIKRMTDGLYSTQSAVTPFSPQPTVHAGTFNSGPIDWTLNFEAATVDTEYQVYCVPAMGTTNVVSDYTDNLPVSSSSAMPALDSWKIFQLVDINFTANFQDGESWEAGGVTVVADAGTPDTFGLVAAGAILPTLANNGVWDVDIEFTIDQEQGNLRFNTDRTSAPYSDSSPNDTVSIDDITLPTTGDLPEILDINCVASIVTATGNPKKGKILGTITLGNVGLTDQSLIFPVSQFFMVV